jgi:Domain of unknown function (DUF5110)
LSVVTIRVYSGANGRFRWYEDDGLSQEYLNGKSAWTELRWDDAARRLTIERAMTAGTLERTTRKLVVQLLPEGAANEIDHDGSRAEVRFQVAVHGVRVTNVEMASSGDDRSRVLRPIRPNHVSPNPGLPPA